MTQRRFGRESIWCLASTAGERQGSDEFERMTCRIERAVIGEGLVSLRVSGRITGQDVNILRALLEQETRELVVDLKDLLLVDREVVKFLARAESNGVELRYCSAYIREWITKQRVDGSGSKQGTEASEDPRDVRCEPLTARGLIGTYQH
jgi:hypothetical protein